MIFDDDRVRAVLRGRREALRVPFPGATEIDIGVRVLTGEEISSARLEAQAHAKKRGALLNIDPEWLDLEITACILARACVDPEDPNEVEPRPFFARPEEVKELDQVAIQTLWQCYLDNQDRVNPLDALSPDRVLEVVDALGKDSSSEGLLSGLDAPSLRTLVRTLAHALRSSQTTKSATG